MKEFILFVAAFASLLAGAADTPLKPLLAVPDKVVYREDFSKAGPFNKEHWGARQGTRWAIEDGVLRGRPSSPEFQAKKKDHFGYEPRISAPVTPLQFVAEFSVRFSGGTETAISPFVEFGHHVVRVQFTKDGVYLLAEHDTLRIAGTTELKYEPGRWYHCLAELKGDEFVIQFAGGPTLYGKHPSYAQPASSGANGFGLAGPKDGLAEVDNVTFWTVKPETQPGWAVTRAKFPAFKPIAAKAAPAKKAAKK